MPNYSLLFPKNTLVIIYKLCLIFGIANINTYICL